MATKAMKIMSKRWKLVDCLIFGFKHGDYARAKREKRADHEWDGDDLTCPVIQNMK